MGFLQHNAQHCINAICPLRFFIGKDEMVVRCFDAAGNQLFFREDHLFIDPGIVQCNFLRVRQKNEVIRLDDAAILGIYLVGILFLCGVELQDVAGLALVAAQLLSGEHDFLRCLIQSGIL